MTMKNITKIAVGAASLSLSFGAAVAEPKTNMLHQWDSGADAAAIAKLGEFFEAAGGTWQQTSIAGHTANTLAKLRADVIAGNAPPAVQLKGPEIAEWDATGMTANLDELAAAEGWDAVVAPELIEVMKPTGSWVAAPMNIHRVNWMWAGVKAMEKAGIEAMPKTWAEFNTACEKAVDAGLICIAHGSADWTDATTFDSVVYGMDIDLYRKAFTEADIEAIRSDEMVAAFAQYRKMINWMDPGIPGRPWDAALAMMTNAEAVFFFMGDWTIGTLNANNMVLGEDYLCDQAPVDWGKRGYILNADSVVFFEQSDPDFIEGQNLLASLILSKDFQSIFNKAKGSIPARMDVDMSEGFNGCQVLSLEDLQASISDGTLVRSMAHNMTVVQKYRAAMMETITEFVNTPEMSAEEAASLMGDAVEAEM